MPTTQQSSNRSMRALVLSDLHIGDLRAEKRFVEISTLLVETEFDSLILNGDIFDLWLEKNPMVLGKYALVKQIAEISKTKRVVWVIGNHDHAYNKVKCLLPDVAIADELKFMAAGMRICIIHGHQVYPFENRGWHSRLLTRINSWIHKVTGIDFQRLSQKTFLYKRSVNKYRKKIIEQHAARADCVVTGHTHLLGTCRHNGVRLYDAGSTAFIGTYATIEDNGAVYLRRL